MDTGAHQAGSSLVGLRVKCECLQVAFTLTHTLVDGH